MAFSCLKLRIFSMPPYISNSSHLFVNCRFSNVYGSDSPGIWYCSGFDSVEGSLLLPNHSAITSAFHDPSSGEYEILPSTLCFATNGYSRSMPFCVYLTSLYLYDNFASKFFRKLILPSACSILE